MTPEHRRLLQEAWTLDRQGQREPAVAAYRAFLAVEPRSAAGWADLGGLLLVMGRSEPARQACEQALGLDPLQRTAQINLAAVLLDLGRLEPAQALCRRILAGDPRCLEARRTLAQCLIRAGDPAQARTVLQEALDLAPADPAVRAMLKNLSILQGDWSHLRQDLERDLLALSGPELDYHQAHLCLMFGEMARGWRLYESRLRIPGLVKPARQFLQPRWNGEPFPGLTLLLHWEQGFGDTLMFLRYATLAKALGGRVVVSVQRELAEVAGTCAGVDQVVAHGDPLPPFDLQLSLGSLPLVCRTDLASIPATVPYLDVPDRVPHRRAIAETLAASVGKTRVGFVWAGSPIHLKDRDRSLPPEALAPLAGLPGVAWHSFQLEGGPGPLLGSLALGPLLANFADTAYALSGMDLVIAADTAVAHLAGALGIPTLLLLPFLPDFRWLLDRDDSPWYPSLRLYRQPQPGDWSTVIQRVLRDLTS